MFLLGIIFGIIEAIISSILGLFFIKNYKETRIKATFFLIFLVYSITANGILFALIMGNSNDNSTFSFWFAYWIYAFLIIMAIMTICSLYLFFEYLEYGGVRLRIFASYTGIVGATYALIFAPNQMMIFYSEIFSSWMINLSLPIRLMILIIAIFVVCRLLQGIIVIYKQSPNKKIRGQFFATFFGVTLALVGLFISSLFGIFLSNYNFILGSIFRGIYPIFISVGLILTTVGFYKNPYAIFLVSQKIFKLIVFKPSGIILYEQEFIPSSSKQATLISGAIHGVSTMIQSAIGTESRPKSIKFEDRIIIFNFIDDIGFAIISDKDSRLLRDELKNFSNLFLKKYSKELKVWDGTVGTFKDASLLIEKAFPFLKQ